MIHKETRRLVPPVHHDGHGLNDLITIYSDEPDVEKGGGACHRYRAIIGSAEPSWENDIANVQFQHGPRNVEGSEPGCTDGVLLAILIDRYEGFQAGPYACAENAETLGYMKAALGCMKSRADERASRGVLGKLKE